MSFKLESACFEPVHSTGEPAVRHAVITEDSITQLVTVFYTTIQTHPRLGPIFQRRLEGKWDEHLRKMVLFWQAVLLKNGAYKGKPVPAHLKLKEIIGDDFHEWLSVFRPVASELFEPESAGEIIATAERIAQSLWLAMFGTPGSAPPPELSSIKCSSGARHA